MTLDYFKEIVDTTPANIPAGLENIYKYLGISENGSYTHTVVTDQIYKLIKESLSSDPDDDHITLTQFLMLKDELVYREVLEGDSARKFLEILNVIRDACRHELKYIQGPSSQKQWKAAIQYAVDYLEFSPNTYLFFETLREQYPKDYDRALSAKKLRELGCNVNVAGGEIVFEGVNEIYENISNKVKSLGGLTVAKLIFSFLGEKAYSETFERYKIVRDVSTIENDKEPQVPFGYLLNLCVKYPYFSKHKTDNSKDFAVIVDLATVTVNAVYGAQPYSQWESILLDGNKIIKFLTNIALWDAMYSIPQCKPSTALEIALGVFNPLSDDTFLNDFGFRSDEVRLVVQKVNEQIKNKKGPIMINFDELDKKLYRIKNKKIECILDLMSHMQSANKEYHEPSDYLKIDFNFKPFIKTGKLSYLVLDKSWCSPAYFEAIATKIRDANKNLDQQLGHPIEDFLHGKFKENGIVALTGEYRYQGLDGECDFLIETDKAIILIEVKKKVLTRKSKSGSDTEIIIDLSDSILEAQRQAGRTAIILMDAGSITLKQPDGSNKIVELKGREIERIALTQLEYGGFQDRMVMEKFLMTLLSHKVNTTSQDKRVTNKLAALNAKQQDWVEQYKKLCILDSKFEHWPYRNCWFFSLPQLIELINVSQDSESFYKAFTGNKYVSTGTMDWYTEYEYMMKLNNSNIENSK